MKKQQNSTVNKPRKPMRNPTLPHPAWKWVVRVTWFIAILYAIFCVFYFYLYFTGQINPK